MSFAEFKDICHKACRERNACANGYRQMLASENVSQMMATWRDNWEDIVKSKYSDIIRTALPRLYGELRSEMNRAGIYMNECPADAQKYVRVLITDTDIPVHVYGDAEAYVVGVASVTAHGHAQVFNYRQPADVTLLEYSYGHVECGNVVAKDRSTVRCACNAVIDGVVSCLAKGGTVHAKFYREIIAANGTVVYSATSKNIVLLDNTSQLIIKDEQ